MFISYYCLYDDNMNIRGRMYNYVLYIDKMEICFSNILHKLVLCNINLCKYVYIS